MKPKWLIEDDAFPESVAPFIEAVQQLGLEYKTITQQPFVRPNFQTLFDKDDCVIFYGSLGLAKKISKQTNWVPGVYYDVPKYNCTSYYAALGKFLLNGNYIMLPFSELQRQKEFLFECVGQDRTVFIRPNRGDKIFTGKMVLKEEYDKDIDYFGFGDIDPSELVIVSEPRNISNEWRFVVVDGEVITGSQYRENTRVAVAAEYPQAALDFAKNIVAVYNPEPAWILDVCRTDYNEHWIMEVGCFSCAGLYACNRTVIIEKISAIALKEWEDIFEG